MEANALMTAVTSGISEVITWIGSVVTALMSGGLSALLPLYAIGIAISAVLLGVRVIRSVVWAG